MHVNHQLQLVYDSERANPQEYLFEVEHSTESDNLNSRYLVTNVVVEGINLKGEEIAVKSQGVDDKEYKLTSGDTIWKLQTDNGVENEYVAKAVVGLDVSDLKTGLYSATIDGGILTFNEGKFDNSDRETTSKSVAIVNSSNSPFGSGWNLAGLQEIFVNEEESALLVDGDGTELVFVNKNAQNRNFFTNIRNFFAGEPDPEYAAPLGDFSQLEYLEDVDNFTGFRRTLKDQTVYEFPARAVTTTGGKTDIRYLLSSVKDRNGNEVTYSYDSEGIIDSITFPGNKEVDFVIENGLITEIKTPGNKNGGNLTQLGYNGTEPQLAIIKDPDESMRQWTYVGGTNFIETETTKLGATYTYGYEAGGAATLERSGGSDASNWTVQPANTYGLRFGPDGKELNSGFDVTKVNKAPTAYQVADVVYTEPAFSDTFNSSSEKRNT